MVKSAVAMTHLPVRVLIRPRPGDFTYNDLEILTMLTDIRTMADLGVAGFVVGALTPERTLDLPVLEHLIAAMKGLPWTLHRAFDFVESPVQALKTAIDLGADTVLTSGQKVTALAGAMLIAQLVQQANGRIDIMAGGGVSPEAALELYRFTHCTTYHLSGRSLFRNNLPEGAAPKMNHPTLNPDHLDAITDPGIIQTLRKILDQP
jgi:copper homeostasis protein